MMHGTRKCPASICGNLATNMSDDRRDQLSDNMQAALPCLARGAPEQKAREQREEQSVQANQ